MTLWRQSGFALCELIFRDGKSNKVRHTFIVLLYCTLSKSSQSSSQYNLIPSQIKRNTVFRCGEKRSADTYNTTHICLVHCTHLKSHHRTRLETNEASIGMRCFAISPLFYSHFRSPDRLQNNWTPLATRSAARLSRHVGSTVSCGEWEERKRDGKLVKTLEFSFYGLFMQQEMALALRLADGSVRFFKFSTAIKSSKKFLLSLSNLCIKYWYWSSACPHRRIPTLQTYCLHSQIWKNVLRKVIVARTPNLTKYIPTCKISGFPSGIDSMCISPSSCKTILSYYLMSRLIFFPLKMAPKITLRLSTGHGSSYHL